MAKHTREKINKLIIDSSEENVLLADGFESAFIGIGHQFNKAFACYDRAKCIDILINDGMTETEAEEFFEYNVIGAYVGEQTPAFISIT